MVGLVIYVMVLMHLSIIVEQGKYLHSIGPILFGECMITLTRVYIYNVHIIVRKQGVCVAHGFPFLFAGG